MLYDKRNKNFKPRKGSKCTLCFDTNKCVWLLDDWLSPSSFLVVWMEEDVEEPTSLFEKRMGHFPSGVVSLAHIIQIMDCVG